MTMNILIKTLLLILYIGALVTGYKIRDEDDALEFLEKFGYVDDEEKNSMNMVDIKTSIKEYQHMSNLKETGVLDEPTLKKMNSPRCGNKDVKIVRDPNTNEIIRQKRYDLFPEKPKWEKREVTYKIINYSRQIHKNPLLDKNKIDKSIRMAFKIWENAANIQFISSPNHAKADIEIRFTLGTHPEDGYAFDGPGTVLAHAFPPGGGDIGGDVHFDDEEQWTVDSPIGYSMLYVALHEIGHALGLGHSNVKGTIMKATYAPYRPMLKLHDDDIEGIQALYGPNIRSGSQTTLKPQKPTETKPTKTTVQKYTKTTLKIKTEATTKTTQTTTPATTQKTTTQESPWWWSFFNRKQKDEKIDMKTADKSKTEFVRPNICEDSSIDAITMIDDLIYVFKGAYVFAISKDTKQMLSGWPQRIGFAFKNLEDDIDAGFTRRNGDTFFFKGNKYWKYSKTSPLSGYPKRMEKHFNGIPNNVDAALVFPWNDLFYFIKGDKYWVFNPKTKPSVQDIYPKPIDDFGLKHKIDAALGDFSTNSLYFFQMNVIWKFYPSTFKISKDFIVSKDWFGCV